MEAVLSLGYLAMSGVKLSQLRCFVRRASSLEKTLIMGKTEGRRRRGRERMRWLDGITNSMDMNLSKLWEIAEASLSWCVAVYGVSKVNMT